jgi:hypothetical protein
MKSTATKTEQHNMNKCHLDHNTAAQLGYDFYRVDNDYNGNPRYVIHFLAFANDYDKAKRLANSIGFSVYRGKSFGGGFVSQSYNLENTAEQIINLRSEAV